MAREPRDRNAQREERDSEFVDKLVHIIKKKKKKKNKKHNNNTNKKKQKKVNFCRCCGCRYYMIGLGSAKSSKVGFILSLGIF